MIYINLTNVLKYFKDDIWQSKCLNFGWYLPYKPLERENGAWKAHYVNCVKNIHAKPLNKVCLNSYIYFKIF